jgi:creatinine deaminase
MTSSSPAQLLAPALEEARRGRDEGGVPIGAALVVDGKVLAVGRNRRVQEASAIKHGETGCPPRSTRGPRW